MFISLRLTRINAVVLNIANMDHFLQSPASKNSLKKGYIEMLKSYFLETLKSVLGSSIPHYFLHKYNRFLFFNIIPTAPLLTASFFLRIHITFPYNLYLCIHHLFSMFLIEDFVGIEKLDGICFLTVFFRIFFLHPSIISIIHSRSA